MGQLKRRRPAHLLRPDQMLSTLASLRLTALLQHGGIWLAAPPELAELLNQCCTGQLDGGPGTAEEVAAVLAPLVGEPGLPLELFQRAAAAATAIPAANASSNSNDSMETMPAGVAQIALSEEPAAGIPLIAAAAPMAAAADVGADRAVRQPPTAAQGLSLPLVPPPSGGDSAMAEAIWRRVEGKWKGVGGSPQLVPQRTVSPCRQQQHHGSVGQGAAADGKMQEGDAGMGKNLDAALNPDLVGAAVLDGHGERDCLVQDRGLQEQQQQAASEGPEGTVVEVMEVEVPQGSGVVVEAPGRMAGKEEERGGGGEVGGSLGPVGAAGGRGVEGGGGWRGGRGGGGRRGDRVAPPLPYAPAAVGCRLVAVRLTLEEAFFLHYVLQSLQVYQLQPGAPIPAISDHVRLLDTQGLWNACRTIRTNFVTSYVAYHHVKAKGWLPRSGLLYGVDYVVYQLHPVGAHSDFGVLVMPLGPDGCRGDGGPHAPELSWLDLQITNRLINQVVKRLVLLYVYEQPGADHSSPACLDNFLVEERLVRRWVPDSTRD